MKFQPLKQLLHHVVVVQKWLTASFNITRSAQATMVNSATDNMEYSSFIGVTVLSVTQLLSVTVLLPVYIFLLLHYRDMIYIFFVRVFGSSHTEK